MYIREKKSHEYISDFTVIPFSTRTQTKHQS